MPFLRLEDGSQLYYQLRGEGRPMVFVHGWSASHVLWSEQVEHLASVCRTVTYDQRGHGRSDRPDGPCTMDVYSHDLAQLLRGLDLDDVVLVGWSMGVIVALEYFQRFAGERVGKLVLLSGSPRLLKSPDWPHGFDAEELRQLGEAMTADRAATTRAFLGGLIGAGHRDAMEERVTRLALDVPLAVAVESFQSELGADLRQVLRAIDVPTLVVHGDQDHPACVGAAGFMLSQLPRAHELVLRHSGHFGPLEAAGELNGALQQFVGY